MVEMRIVFWVAVVITLLSGLSATVLATRRGSSAASGRVADRLAHIALLGASAIIVLLGREN